MNAGWGAWVRAYEGELRRGRWGRGEESGEGEVDGEPEGSRRGGNGNKGTARRAMCERQLGSRESSESEGGNLQEASGDQFKNGNESTQAEVPRQRHYARRGAARLSMRSRHRHQPTPHPNAPATPRSSRRLSMPNTPWAPRNQPLSRSDTPGEPTHAVSSDNLILKRKASNADLAPALKQQATARDKKQRVKRSVSFSDVARSREIENCLEGEQDSWPADEEESMPLKAAAGSRRLIRHPRKTNLVEGSESSEEE